MRRIIVTALLAFAVAPVAVSVAAGGSDAAKNASVACTAQKAKIGALAFAQAYTTFGACVSALTPVEQQNIASATAACTAEQADVNFATAAGHDGKTFAQFYGTGKSGKDAFSKCVSTKAHAASKAEQAARTNPSRTCRSQRALLAPAIFTQMWGTASNAFGKCVSATTRVLNQNENAASTACRSEQDASLGTFTTTYGSNADAFGKCVSTKASAKTQSQQQATVAAAKACANEKNTNVAAFNSKYTTFGRCVSQHANANA
jgi:hypothetical protein